MTLIFTFSCLYSSLMRRAIKLKSMVILGRLVCSHTSPGIRYVNDFFCKEFLDEHIF